MKSASRRRIYGRFSFLSLLFPSRFSGKCMLYDFEGKGFLFLPPFFFPSSKPLFSRSHFLPLRAVLASPGLACARAPFSLPRCAQNRVVSAPPSPPPLSPLPSSLSNRAAYTKATSKGLNGTSASLFLLIPNGTFWLPRRAILTLSFPLPYVIGKKRKMNLAGSFLPPENFPKY